MNIYPLGTTASQNPLRVGGKAAHLARLAARHPVPPGFCIGAGTELAQPFNQALSQAYRRLGQRCGAVPLAVAVRSSAVDEDGLQASFAGQHESYLNVSGEEAVRQAVDRCIESARSQRALAYRQARGLDEHSGVAVLVQQFIPADVSAVVFSADPTSGERGCVVINAAWGIGESLVGGEVTPDLYRVSKDDLRVTSAPDRRQSGDDGGLPGRHAPGGRAASLAPRARPDRGADPGAGLAGLASGSHSGLGRGFGVLVLP